MILTPPTPIKVTLPSNKPKRTINNRKQFKIKNDLSLSEVAELTGKFLGSFVLLTSSLNWMMYRRLNKEIEDHIEKNSKK